MIDVTQLAVDIENCAKQLADMKTEGGCFWLNPKEIDGKRFAIVIGWLNGFDEHENDNFCDKGFRLCVKVAYQSVDSIMQCDYDIDWDEVCLKGTGEVFDTEHPLYPDTNFTEVAESIAMDYLAITNYPQDYLIA